MPGFFFYLFTDGLLVGEEVHDETMRSFPV
jgi:hypothetical protein